MFLYRTVCVYVCVCFQEINWYITISPKMCDYKILWEVEGVFIVQISSKNLISQSFC